MKTLGQMVISAVLGIVLLFGVLGFLGACSNQDAATSTPAGIEDPSAAAEIPVAMDAPAPEDWERLDAVIQDAETYTDLNRYSDEVADLFTRSLENARASFDDPGITKSQVAGRAQQLESLMMVMDRETGAWMEKS